MADMLIAVSLLMFEIGLFFLCRFIKRRFLNLNFLLKSLSWFNWIYWLFFNLIIWQHQSYIFPYDVITGRSQADGVCMLIAFIFTFVLFFPGAHHCLHEKTALVTSFLIFPIPFGLRVWRCSHWRKDNLNVCSSGRLRQ